MYRVSFTNVMTLYICLSCILVVLVDVRHSATLPELSGVETHTFRWTIRNNLNDTSSCATPSTPWRFPNGTLHPDPEWSTLHGCLILLAGAFSPEDHQAICHGNNSVFVLIDNPGIIWHPLTSQCVHTKLVDIPVRRPGEDYTLVHVKRKTLMTSCKCETNNTNVALFKYDKNKPQRLVFLQDVDSKTGKKEEWCIRNSNGGSIEVAPKCGFDSDTKMVHRPVFFHEIF